MKAIEVKHLKKAFGDLQAVQGVDFTVEEGEILCLLGPNGAGKSTIISMLCGLLALDEGEAYIMGRGVMEDPIGAKACLGVVPQDIALYPDLSARENLDFWGRMYGLRGTALKSRVDEVLEIIGLVSRQKDRVDKFSGGMKRRLNIGVALLHKPKVIIMDEPTVGVDPQSRRHILDEVKQLNNQGVGVLHTTHQMDEAEELAHQIAILDHGRIIAHGTHRELINLVGEQTRIDLALNAEPELIMDAWGSIEGISHINTSDGRISVLVDDSNQVLPRLFERASMANVRITSVDIHEPDLETVFLHLTGRALRD